MVYDFNFVKTGADKGMSYFINLYLDIDTDFTWSKENQHLAGRELLRKGLKQDFDFDFSEDMISYGVYGKPELTGSDLYFNISHTKGAVVCAIGNTMVGVDIEYPHEIHESAVDKTCSLLEKEELYGIVDCEAHRLRMFQLWTLKESYMKMIGEGFHFPVNQVNFSFQSEGVACGGEASCNERIFCNQEGYFYQEVLETGHVLAVCTKEKGNLHKAFT
jgi:4'-phosphopantetheinyl transferase